MATATNVAGTSAMNLGFVETITSGVVTTLTLPATINQSITYSNGTTALSVDLIHAKQYTLNAAATTIDLTSIADLNGSTVSFTRIREFVVQNLSSFDVQVYAYSLSGFTNMLPGSASTLYARAAASASSLSGGMIRISDPITSVSSQGILVASSNCKFRLDPGANSCSVNVLILGCSTTT